MAFRAKMSPQERDVDRSFLRGIRDIVLYIVFLVLYTIVIQSNAITLAYPYSEKMREKVVGDDFDDILTIDDIWGYMSGTMLDALYEDVERSGQTLPTDQWGYVLEVNRLIGAMRIDQSRVRASADKCNVPPVYQNGNTQIDVCYPSVLHHSDTPLAP